MTEKEGKKRSSQCSEGPIRLPRIGRAIRLVKRVDEERSGKREEYENISHGRLLRATSCRWCKRDERGVQGIVEVGKLKAEAPFRPADAPLFEKKKKEKKERRE